jgi:hypothetical protein
MNDPDGYLIEECNDPDDQATLEYNALVYFHSIQEDPKDKVAMRRLEETRIRIPNSPIFITIDAYLQMKKAQSKKKNQETFEASNKNLTITTKVPHPRLKTIVADLKPFLERPNIKTWIYTVEKESTTSHIHLNFEFNNKKYRPQVLLQHLRKYLPPDRYDVSHKDKKGKCHLQSKTDAQTYGWLGYILKEMGENDPPDKYIVFKDDPKLIRSLLYKDKNRRK